MRIAMMAALVCLASQSLSAAILRVPEEYPNHIYAYIAAQPGDEIVLAPGTYTMSGSLNVTKRVTFRSTYDGADWSVVESTIIKGGSVGTIFIVDNLHSTVGTVFKGLTLTYDVYPISEGENVKRRGIASDGQNITVDSCIIENCVYLGTRGVPASKSYGAAITGVRGTIQNCIIRNNQSHVGSAMSNCGGVIRNNVIYNNEDDPGNNCISNYESTFLNNTVTNSGGVGLRDYSIMMNCIFWHDTEDSVRAGVGIGEPRNCVIKGYPTHEGGIITSDPKFVDPAVGDFRLRADSPCIDAGLTTEGVRADIKGVQRGLKGVQEPRGDGSGVDIGAFEYIPKPVAVWLPDGGPELIHSGDELTVAWEMETGSAGTAIVLQLYDGENRVADLGAFWNPAGADRSVVRLPGGIFGGAYFIRGVS